MIFVSWTSGAKTHSPIKDPNLSLLSDQAFALAQSEARDKGRFQVPAERKKLEDQSVKRDVSPSGGKHDEQDTATAMKPARFQRGSPAANRIISEYQNSVQGQYIRWRMWP